MSAVALARRAREAHAAADTQFGKYTIGEQLGVGGMATVHRATMTGRGGRVVALKRLLPHLASDPQFLTAFVDEARLASHLRHPNVVQTLDFGQVDGQHFLAMEFIAGPTLLQINKQCASAAGAMPLPIVINILCQILDGLDHAHNLRDASGRPLGIIHRDVSPPNVIVSNTGLVKLIDFGVAKISSSRRTKAGIVKGKLAYVAPEYTHGQLDSRADLFAVGVIAHELLAGKSLFQAGSDWDTLINIRQMPISPPSRQNRHVSRDLDDVVMTALQRDPVLRWQSAVAMRTALANIAQEQRISLAPGPVIEWVEWAFEQKPRNNDSTLARVIDALGEPSRLAALADVTAPAKRRASPPPPPPARKSPSRPPPSRVEASRPAPQHVEPSRAGESSALDMTVRGKRRMSSPPPLPAKVRQAPRSTKPPAIAAPKPAARAAPAKSSNAWPAFATPLAASASPRSAKPHASAIARPRAPSAPSLANRLGWLLLIAVSVFLAAYYFALSSGV